jgi:signal transduction histidine kinase
MRSLTMRQDATVHLNVEDTGMGMPPEHMTQIFEPLYTTKPGGTGLAAYRAGGRRRAWCQVAVQSTVGVGTTFTITLPLAGT